nr:hypothetical protein [Tanacetum cinerariifolium]
MPPTLFAKIDRDMRTAMTFIALWRPVPALEAWAGCVDTRMTNMSWAGCERAFRTWVWVLRHQELAIGKDHVYSTFKVGQGSGSAPEPKRSEKVSVSRQPALTTWTDLEDSKVYIDVPAYPPPAPPAQTPPSHKWSSG